MKRYELGGEPAAGFRKGAGGISRTGRPRRDPAGWTSRPVPSRQEAGSMCRTPKRKTAGTIRRSRPRYHRRLRDSRNPPPGDKFLRQNRFPVSQGCHWNARSNPHRLPPLRKPGRGTTEAVSGLPLWPEWVAPPRISADYRGRRKRLQPILRNPECRRFRPCLAVPGLFRPFIPGGRPRGVPLADPGCTEYLVDTVRTVPYSTYAFASRRIRGRHRPTMREGGSGDCGQDPRR